MLEYDVVVEGVGVTRGGRHVTDGELRGYLAASVVRWSIHGADEADADRRGLDEVLTALAETGHVVEQYPEGQRGPSCLVLAWLPSHQPVHAVIGFGREPWTLVTVYRPDPIQWTEDFTRRR